LIGENNKEKTNNEETNGEESNYKLRILNDGRGQLIN
jgi:hypothetical protein